MSAPAAAGKAPTEVDAREALKKIFAEPGMGQPATIDYLKKHGVVQISKLPPAMYAAFIAGVEPEINAFRARKKAAA